MAGDYDEITRKRHKNTYRPFSIDKNSGRFNYWSPCSLEDMKDWDDWDYTDEHIEHWQPNKKKVILYKESSNLRGERMCLKSGVYFVHFDDIPLFVETAKAQGRTFCGDYQTITRKGHKNTYRPFSIDKNSLRFSYWHHCSLEDMKDWDDWDFTDEYIEHWQPNKKKVIL